MKKVLGTLFSWLIFLIILARALNGCIHYMTSYKKESIDRCNKFNYNKDYEKAIDAGKLAVEVYPQNSEAYRCLGEAYYNVGELDLAYENTKKAERLANSDLDLIYTYNQMGKILYKMGKLDDALLYYNKSLSFIKSLETKNSSNRESDNWITEIYNDFIKIKQVEILNSIALIYEEEGQLDKALSYYEKSLNLTTDKETKVAICENIAKIYDKKGIHQIVIECTQKANETDEKTKNRSDTFLDTVKKVNETLDKMKKSDESN
jgi:tetratricopeptide (TPR) repeat protein